MAAKGSASPPEWARCDALSEVLADSWWAVGLRGVLGILFGLICLLTPGIALGAFVILFSAYMLVDGVFAIISGIKAARSGERWGLLILEGIVDIAAGLVAFLWPLIPVVALTWLVAIWAIVSGALMLSAAFTLNIDHGQIHHKRRPLYTDNFLCLFSPEQLNLVPPISLADYLRVPHVLTSLSADAHGAVDDVLAKLKLKRTIALTTPGFLAVPFVLRRAPIITTMPSRLARYFAEAFGLATSPPPIELPTFTISLLWHASFDQDSSHVWLRQTVAGLGSEAGLEL